MRMRIAISAVEVCPEPPDGVPTNSPQQRRELAGLVEKYGRGQLNIGGMIIIASEVVKQMHSLGWDYNEETDLYTYGIPDAVVSFIGKVLEMSK